MLNTVYPTKTLFILLPIFFLQNAISAQNTSNVDQMIRQRDSLEMEIKLEQLREVLGELNSASKSFVAGESGDLEKVMSLVEKLCDNRIRYQLTSLKEHSIGPSKELLNRVNVLKQIELKSSESTSLLSDSVANKPDTSDLGPYGLGNRSAVFRAKPKYNCTGEGIVIVKVFVDRDGVVQKVEGHGQKGTTAIDDCLIRRAEEAALMTKWQPDPNALELQVGTIRYTFQRT
jgi:hypothetical protein